MSGLRIKGWGKFQSFKDRCPPWIKLYRDILDDPEWHALDAQSAKVLIMLWLVASDDKTRQGLLPDINRLSFRLRIDPKTLSSLIPTLSHWVIQDDIKTISSCDQDDIKTISSGYQVGPPETETETETETEGETDSSRSIRSPKPTADLSPIFGMWSDVLGPLGIPPLEDGLTKTAATRLGVLSRNSKWMADLPDLLEAIAASEWHLGKNEVGFVVCARWLVKSDKTQDLLSRHRTKARGRPQSQSAHSGADLGMNRAMDDEAQRLREIMDAREKQGTQLF